MKALIRYGIGVGFADTLCNAEAVPINTVTDSLIQLVANLLHHICHSLSELLLKIDHVCCLIVVRAYREVVSVRDEAHHRWGTEFVRSSNSCILLQRVQQKVALLSVLPCHTPQRCSGAHSSFRFRLAPVSQRQSHVSQIARHTAGRSKGCVSKLLSAQPTC